MSYPTDPSSAGTVSRVQPVLPMKAVVAVVIGNWLEFYDFLVFTFFAVMIGDAFFPAESEIGRLLGALATFGVGFVTRPLGAAIIGPYADRVGRRAALTLTLLLMSVGSGMVALTPPYTQIGIAAPILLVLARLIQGFSCGGEVGPATTYLLESAPPEKRAAVTAWQAYSQQLASIMGAGFGVILAATLSKEQLYAWGWRIPFLLGVVIAPVALYIRRQLPETIEESQTHRSTGAVLGELVRHHSRAVVSWRPHHLRRHGLDLRAQLHDHLRDHHAASVRDDWDHARRGGQRRADRRTGRWRLARSPRPQANARSCHASCSCWSSIRSYVILTSPDATLQTLVAGNLFLNFVFAIGIGAAYAFLAEAFPQSVRSSGLAILYALGVTIFGGTTQFVVAWLIDVTKDPMVPAWYQIVATMASIVGIMLLTPHAEVLRGRAVRAEART